MELKGFERFVKMVREQDINEMAQVMANIMEVAEASDEDIDEMLKSYCENAGPLEKAGDKFFGELCDIMEKRVVIE